MLQIRYDSGCVLLTNFRDENNFQVGYSTSHTCYETPRSVTKISLMFCFDMCIGKFLQIKVHLMWLVSTDLKQNPLNIQFCINLLVLHPTCLHAVNFISNGGSNKRHFLIGISYCTLLLAAHIANIANNVLTCSRMQKPKM